jgi:outer membrane protein OmpA-like peptidoglycan-associated protein
MKLTRIWLTILPLAGLAVVATWAQDSRSAGEQESEFDALYRQIHNTYDDLANDPDADQPLELEGPWDRPDLSSGLRALRRANPVLTQTCKKEALRNAIASHSRLKGATTDQSLAAVRKHVRERQAIVTKEGVSVEGFFRHLTECKGFCGPHAVELLSCHVLSVSGSDHDIVLFDWDSSYIENEYNRGVVARFTDRARRETARRILLIGRASPPGGSVHNMQLSAERVLALKDRFVERGVAETRIATLWLGEEPPQLEAWMAKRYGFGGLLLEVGPDPFNQSVVVVIY